jgi:hypothetical protein
MEGDLWARGQIESGRGLVNIHIENAEIPSLLHSVDPRQAILMYFKNTLYRH